MCTKVLHHPPAKRLTLRKLTELLPRINALLFSFQIPSARVKLIAGETLRAFFENGMDVRKARDFAFTKLFVLGVRANSGPRLGYERFRR